MPIVSGNDTLSALLPTPYRATLTSFGAVADGKVVKKAGFTLQGTSNGSVWVTLAADTYRVRRKTGFVERRDVDDSGNDTDWSAYTDYQDLGNQAFRVTYTVKTTTTETTYTNEALTFAESDPYYSVADDGSIGGEFAQDLFVDEIHADLGDIGGWIIGDTTISSDSGNVTLDASQKSLRLGAATDYDAGNGVFLGKSGGVYKFRIGATPSSGLDSLYWDGSNLYDTGRKIGGKVGGIDVTSTKIYIGAGNYNNADTAFYVDNTGKMSLKDKLSWDGSTLAITGTITASAGAIGGFTIGADYLKDAADSFGLASTVTGGDDVRFWAGANFASRASAPLQLYESGYIFAKDIVLAKGALTGASGASGYGYAVGDPLFLCHYDGARPFESDFHGSVVGHKGQVGTYTWGGTEGRALFRPGKFNKAVQVAEGTTNLFADSSFETNPVTTYWSVDVGGGTGTAAYDTAHTYFHNGAVKMVKGSVYCHVYQSITTAADTYTVSCYVYKDGTAVTSSDFQFIFNSAVVNPADFVSVGGGWYLAYYSAAETAAAHLTGLRANTTLWVDGAQFERLPYPTPLSYFSFDGHSGSVSTTSVRPAGALAYPASGNVNLVQGTFSCWFFATGVAPAYGVALGCDIDANNYLLVLLNAANAATQTPYAISTSGGSSVQTYSGEVDLAPGWHHLVCTWTAGALKLYIDGDQSGNTANYVVPVGTLSTLYIGNRSGSSNFVDTYLDDVCILPYVLSDHEVKAIYYSDAPVMLGISNQEIRLSGAGLGDVFGNANGLFGRNADGGPSFGILNGTVNATTWGGATETLNSGDFMFGDNNTAKPNMMYDASAGALLFRVGTTAQMTLDSTGVGINAAEGTTENATLHWLTTGGKPAGSISTYYSTSGNVAWMAFDAKGTTTGDKAYANLRAISYANKTAAVQCWSDGEISVDVSGGRLDGTGQQRVRLRAKQSAAGSISECVTVEMDRTSGSDSAGFGSAIGFYATGGAWQGGVGAKWAGPGATNGNLVLSANNLVTFSHGGGAPSITGVRTGTLAQLQTVVQNLLAALSTTLSLVADNTT